MTVQMVKSPTGEAAVMMSQAEYEDLIDARDHALALRDIAAGNMTMLSDADMDAYLDAPTPLAFWRKHRNVTQAKLATAAEITQPYVAQIESGQKEASASIYAKMARYLGIRIDDLVVD